MRFFLVFFLFVLSSFALEFEEVGHRASTMGGVGVAMKNNPYAIFYNPALASANDNARMGYALSAAFGEKNLLDVFNFDLNNIQDISKFNKLLDDNLLRTKAQGAWALKAPSNLIFGDLSIGFMINVYTASTFTGRLANDITAINDNIDFKIRRLDTVELPVAYSFALDTALGELSWGAALKFMSFSNVELSRKLGVTDSKSSIQKEIKSIMDGSNSVSAYNYGIDLGFAYSPAILPEFSLGLSGRNLNRPKFNFKEQGKITAFPQARLGLAYELGEGLLLGMDADLTRNIMLSPSATKKQYSQKIGIGVDAHTPFFSARAGLASDIAQKNGLIMSFGLGFGLVDIGVSASTKKGKVDDVSYPRYFSLHLGGSYEF